MFLTINRITIFDAAIQSRIHLALKYNELKRLAREQVWKTFLEQANTAFNISGKNIEWLLDHQLNRRQVKQYLNKSFEASTNILY